MLQAIKMFMGFERKVWIHGVTVLHDYPSVEWDHALDGAFILA